MEGMKKYEVTLSVRMHGTFVVEAESEQEAEDIIGKKYNEDEIKTDALDFADDTHIDCVGEVETDKVDFPAEVEDAEGEDDDEDEGEDEGHFCPRPPMHLRRGMFVGRKGNCEYYQGLCDGRAESEK